VLVSDGQDFRELDRPSDAMGFNRPEDKLHGDIIVVLADRLQAASVPLMFAPGYYYATVPTCFDSLPLWKHV
jgi:hypothetical protein